MSSRKYYLSNRDNKLLSTYRSSIIESAILLNATNRSKLDEYANQITEFEKLLALSANLPENRRNYSRIYNVSTFLIFIKIILKKLFKKLLKIENDC